MNATRNFHALTSTGNGNITASLRNVFIVYEMDYKTRCTVQLRKVECSCHVPYWNKLPCLHIIAVLYERQEYTRVWSMIGNMYLMNEVSETWRELTKEKRKVINSIVVNNRDVIEVTCPFEYDLLNSRGTTIGNTCS